MPRKNPTTPYIVSVVQDLSECAEVQVDATSSSEAEEIVSELLRHGKLDKLITHAATIKEIPTLIAPGKKMTIEQSIAS